MNLVLLILLISTLLVHTIGISTANVGTNTLEELIRSEYDKFKSMYGSRSSLKSSSLQRDSAQQEDYTSERYKSFANNFERIHMFNNEADQKNVSFRLAVNRFADMKHAEFTRYFTGFIPESQAPGLKNAGESMKLHSRLNRRRRSRKTTTTTTTRQPFSSNAPDSIDWRDQNVVTSVKYQGLCGACWAFSTASVLESHYAIKSGNLNDFSEQQLIDCSSNGRYGNAGCAGGLMSWAFDYIMNKGEMDESDYQYKAKQGSCRYSTAKVQVQINSYERVNTEDEMFNIVGTVGPVTAALYASPNFQSYASGILEDPLCESDSVPNHAIVIIGYGSDAGKDYWLIKNSWGPDWGENGYARILRGVNMCRIQSEITYPILD